MANASETLKIPRHVTFTMDGNGRWAEARGLPVKSGHEKGAKRITPLVRRGAELGVKEMSFWAMSTENFGRPEDEVRGLMEVFDESLQGPDADELRENGVRVRVSGDMSRFPSHIQAGVEHIVSDTKDNDTITVNFLLNYGGREEILRAGRMATRRMMEMSTDGLSDHDFNSLHTTIFEASLYTAGLQDPDLIIRTGGHQRTSGLMPYQSVYAELVFTDTLWPDYTPDEFQGTIVDFGDIQRNFGKRVLQEDDV